MMSPFPYSVDFIVTDRCNLHCPVCWGSGMPEYEAAPLETRLLMTSILREQGVKKAVFTGGEPLLEKNLPYLMGHALENRMETILFTNCTLMEERAVEVLPYTCMISVSLDGSTEENNAAARKPGHFGDVMNTLRLLREKYSRVKTQALTVVTRKNTDDLENIGHLLESETRGLDFQWKLNFYQPIGRQNPEFSMDYSQFKEAATAVQKKFAHLGTRYSTNEHDWGYLFVFPDGQMYTTEGGKYVRLGNIFDHESYDNEQIRRINLNIAKRGHEIIGQLGGPGRKR